MSVRENIALPNRKALSSPLGVLKRGQITTYAKDLANDVNLRPPKIELEAGAYSGGNQQKVVVAKWLGRTPALFVLDEPTRGVDVGAKHEIYALADRLAAEGGGILFISSELEELTGMCDRIMVMSRGEVTAEFSPPYDRETVLAAAFREVMA